VLSCVKFHDEIWVFFFKMAVVHHLDLLYAYLDHPRKVFGDVYHCAKFGWN